MNASAEGSAAAKAGKRLVVLLMIVASAGYVSRVAVTIVAPGMMRDFGLSQTQMGTVFSAFLAGYTIFQIPSGWLADRVECRRIYLTLCAGWAALTALTALVAWKGFAAAFVIPQLLAIRVLLGVVTAPTYPTSSRTIAVTIPPRFQARANGMVFASLGVGSALAPALLAPVSDRFGWRAALIIAAVLSAGAGVVWASLAPRQVIPQETDQTEEGARRPEVSFVAKNQAMVGARTSLWSASFCALCASYVLESYLGYIFVFWFYLYLVEVRHFEVLKAAGVTALPWVATIFAIPLGGVLSDAAVARWGAQRGRRSIPVWGLCLAAAFLVLGARTPSAAVAVASLTACTVLVLSTEGAFWSTMAQLSGAQSGLAGGIMNFGGNLGGLVSPVLTPWLAQKIGWKAALTSTAVLAIVAALLWLGVRLDSAPAGENRVGPGQS